MKAARRTASAVRWHRRLDVRLAAALVAALLVFEFLSKPVYRSLSTLLGAPPLGESRIASVVWFLVMTGIAILLAVVISRRVTRRLAGMSDLASRPLPCGRLPGPFDESGGDEVARLAGTMNAMRQRVNQLLDDVARQEVQRREWLAQVSHDLRTPLTALVACLDRAELALQSPRPETLYQEVPDLLAVAKLDIDRVESLANDLFEIARLEANDALNLEPVPPGELVRQTVRGLEPLAAKKGVKLQVRLGLNLPILNADGRRLMRALENLLRNAIQHAVAYVWIQVERGGETLRFEVRDDGVGFPEQRGTLSFDDLRSRRSREDSAGLGLMVTQRVAEAHGGAVGAHNSDTGGAVVWFALPATPEAAEALDSEVGLAS